MAVPKSALTPEQTALIPLDRLSEKLSEIASNRIGYLARIYFVANQ
ncbi:hypothetical protein QUB68_19710 [Microcoleus sp. A006_D1]